MANLTKPILVAVAFMAAGVGASLGLEERNYQMQHYGDIVLRGMRVEKGAEMKRLRDLIGAVRDWELSSTLVSEEMGGAETRKLLEEIKRSPGFTVTPIYSPQTVYWIKFDRGDTRMVVEDTELKTLLTVRPQRGEALPLHGFWAVRPKGSPPPKKTP
jgi:hypothetical protein